MNTMLVIVSRRTNEVAVLRRWAWSHAGITQFCRGNLMATPEPAGRLGGWGWHYLTKGGARISCASDGLHARAAARPSTGSSSAS